MILISSLFLRFVIELKPEISAYPESGFEYPEEKITQAALEIYDGFIEYIKSFFITHVDDAIVKECKNKLIDMKNNLENYEETINEE